VIAAVALLAVGCRYEEGKGPRWLRAKWGRRSIPLTPPTYVAPEPVAAAPAEPAAPSDEPLGLPADTSVIMGHPSQLPAAAASETSELADPGSSEPAADEEDWSLDVPAPAEPDDDADVPPTEPIEDGPNDPPLDDDDDVPMMAEFGSGSAADDAPVNLTDLVDDDPPQRRPRSGSIEDDTDDAPPSPPEEADDPPPASDDTEEISVDDEISLGRDSADLPPVGDRGRRLLAASMVQINDRFITVEDVLRPLHQAFTSMPRPSDETAFHRQAAGLIGEELQRQFTQMLVLIEAEHTLTDQQKTMIDEEMDKTLRQLIADAGGSRSDLERECRRRYTTLDDLLADHEKRMITQSFLRMKLLPKIVVTRRMLLDYYRAHPETFVEKRTVQMQVIAAPFDAFLPPLNREPSEAERTLARAQARRQIEQAAEAIEAGEDFGVVARRLSRGVKADDGGLWPPLTEGAFKEAPVQRNAMLLRPGEICGIIETASGDYIVKTLRIRRGRTVSFEDAQPQITEMLEREQYDRLSQAYFKELLAAATISESSQFMEHAVEQAVVRYGRP